MSKFGDYLKTKSFRNNILLAIGSVIVVVLIAFFSLGFYTDHGSGIPVPKLKGLSVDNAINVLKEQGFGYVVDSVYILDKSPGTIVEQDPDPGTNVKENRIIYLTMVSRLAPNVSLPVIEQIPYITAAATLASYGLKVGDTVYRSDIARDMVLEARFAGQPIKAGTKIPKGSKIDLVLGNGAGAAEVEIPDLIGQDLDAAKFVIKNAGLTLGTILRQGAVTDTSNAVVVAQSPMPADSTAKVSIGTTINLTITQGKKNGPN
jgi:beta-lactam-binding protein with PASTA domain